MTNHFPRVHQIENHMLDADYYWTKERSVPWNDLDHLVDPPGLLWSNGFSTCAGVNDRVPHAEALQFRDSLRLIKPSRVTISVVTPGAPFGNPKRAVRAEF